MTVSKMRLPHFMKRFHVTVLIFITAFCHAGRTIDVWPEGRVPGEVSDSSVALVP